MAKGSPFTSSRAFGTRSVTGRRRVASPPARIATVNPGFNEPGFNEFLLRMCHHRGSGKVELHTDFAKPRMAHDCPKASFLFRVKHKKSAPAGANEFAAERSIGPREFIQLIDLPVTHTGRSFPLVFPMHVHQIGNIPQVAG